MKSRYSFSGIEAASGLLDQMLASDAAKALADERTAPRRFFDRLVHEGLLTDALQVLPHLLPKPVAVWWGYLCVWEAYRPEPPPKVAAVLEAVWRWLAAPTEANRRALEEPMDAAGHGTAAGCLAAAACWSGGSMSRPGLPDVLPPPHLTARFLAATALLTAAARQPHRCVERHAELLGLGLQVARGQLLFPGLVPAQERPMVAAAERETADRLHAALAGALSASGHSLSPELAMK